MAANIEVAQVAAATSTGNQDITTTDLGGNTPKAVIIFAGMTTSAGTEAANACLCTGFTDGTNEFCGGNSSEDGVVTTNVSRFAANDAIVLIPSSDTDTIDGEAVFVSFISDGVRINWSNAPTTAVLLTAVFFEGDDISVHCNQVTNVVSSEPVDVTDPAFEPDLVFGLSYTIAGSAIANNHWWGGLSPCSIHYNGASLISRQLAFRHRNNQPNTQVSSILNTDAADNGHIDVVATSGDGITDAFQLHTFDANGFTIESGTGGAPSTAIDFLYLAVQIANHSIYLNTYNPPTSTDTSYEDTTNQPGFTPQFVMLGCTMHTAEDTISNVDPAGVFGWGLFTPDSEFSIGFNVNDAADPTDDGSIADTKAIRLLDEAGSDAFTATFVSMNASDFTLNYSVADGTQRKFWQLCIEEEAAGGLENTITFAAGLNDILANLGIFQNAELFRTGLSDTKAPTSIFQAIRSFDLGLTASHLGEVLSAAVENTITFALGLAESKVAQSIFNRTISFSTGLAESKITRLILSDAISFGIGLRDTLNSLLEGIVENTITFAVGFAESKVVNSVFTSVISFGTGFRDLLNTTGVFNHFITFATGLRDLLSPSVITSKTITFATGFAARHVGNIIEVLEGVITFGLGLADNLASTSRRTWELTVRAVSVWRKPDNSK